MLLVILAALSIGYLGLSVLSAAIGWTGVAAVAIAALLVSLSYEIGGRH